MMNAGRIERLIDVAIQEHKVTHLLVATSKSMPGLYVAARSVEQIRRELPGAIRELLEAEGNVVHSVSADQEASNPTGFQDWNLVASALMDDFAHV